MSFWLNEYLSTPFDGRDGSRNKTNLAYNYIVSFDNERTDRDRQAEEQRPI